MIFGLRNAEIIMTDIHKHIKKFPTVYKELFIELGVVADTFRLD